MNQTWHWFLLCLHLTPVWMLIILITFCSTTIHTYLSSFSTDKSLIKESATAVKCLTSKSQQIHAYLLRVTFIYGERWCHSYLEGVWLHSMYWEKKTLFLTHCCHLHWVCKNKTYKKNLIYCVSSILNPTFRPITLINMQNHNSYIIVAAQNI